MKVHRFIHDPDELLEQGQQIVKQNADNKFVHRVSMVNLVLSGMTPGMLAQYCGDGERTINTWVKRVDEEGWDALVAVKQKGRPNLLTDDQISEIKQAVNDDPETHGYHVWDGPALSDFIKSKYNVDYGVRASQKLLHKMGFSLIRPQTYPSLENSDDETREDFKKTTANKFRSRYCSSISG